MAIYIENRRVPIPVRIPSHAPSRIDLEIEWDEEFGVVESVSVLIEGRGGYGYFVPVQLGNCVVLEGSVAGEKIVATSLPNLIEILSERAHDLRRDDKCFWTLLK